MNISIIGLGWLGLPLAKKLQKTGHKIVGTTSSPDKKIKLNSLFNVSIFDAEHNEKLANEILINCNLAIITIPPFIKSPENKYAELLLAIVKQFSQETNFIFTSSTSVYPNQSGCYNETSALNQNSPITIAENKLRDSIENRLTILRLGGLYGPNRHPIFHIQGRNNIKNPNGRINFIHQEDIIDAILKVVEFNEFGHIFNLVNQNKPTRQEYYTGLVTKLNLEPIDFDKSGNELIERKVNSTSFLDKFNTTFSRSLYPPFE